MRDFFDIHSHRIEAGFPCGCWLWSAGAMPDGYGAVVFNGKTHLAHRLAYECAHGVGSAAGRLVRHKCDTPACVNPYHLELGSHAQNSRDMVARGRSAKGSRASRAKLSEEKVSLIRQLHRDVGATPADLGARFGVDPSAIRQLLAGKTWRHVA